jgi:hypothetical protein
MWWYARVSKHGLLTYCECCYDTMLQTHRMMPIDDRAQGLTGRSCICLCQRAVTEHSPCDAGTFQSHRYITIARAADVLSHAMTFITRIYPALQSRSLGTRELPIFHCVRVCLVVQRRRPWSRSSNPAKIRRVRFWIRKTVALLHSAEI